MSKKNKGFDTSAKDELASKLDDMNKRLGRNVDQKQAKGDRKSDAAGYGNAMRLSSEFISAILVGAVIGYGIDWLAGTQPWALIVFFLLGFVAGVKNVLRAAERMSKPDQSDPSSGGDGGSD